MDFEKNVFSVFSKKNYIVIRKCSLNVTVKMLY